MASITPVPLVNLFACDRANTVTTRITAEGSTAFAHTPFGHRSPDTGEDNGAGFNGQHQERDGAYLLGHGYRAYRPALGRFTAPDSYSPFWGGGLNCYTYCRAEPVNRQDPSGHADDNTFNYVLIGLGIFAGVSGLGVTAFKPRFAGPGIGTAAGGILAAGIATMGLGSVDAGFKDRLNIAAILLLLGGAMVGGGTMFMRGGRSKPRLSVASAAGISPTSRSPSVSSLGLGHKVGLSSSGSAAGLSRRESSSLDLAAMRSEMFNTNIPGKSGFTPPTQVAPPIAPLPVPMQSAPTLPEITNVKIRPRGFTANLGATIPDPTGLTTYQRFNKAIRERAARRNNQNV